MYCESCGALNSDGISQCASCGAPLAGAQSYGGDTRHVEVPDYLVRAIVVTILLFFPFGIPAIVNAVESKNKIAEGDIDGAIASAERSKMWSNVAIGVGIPMQLLVFIIYFAISFAGLGDF